MPVFRLTLEYDGTDFAGWQVQPGGRRTVQGVLETAVARVAGQRVRVRGASRTDAGVHALGQVVSVGLDTGLSPERLAGALNAVLPADVAVREAARAPDDFDARRHARSKLYRYRIWNHPARSPLRRRQWLCFPRPLDLPAMRRAAVQLSGDHDFRSFTAAKSGARSFERRLRRLDLTGEAGGEIRVLAEGDAFLRHMVRILVGTLLEVGTGRRDPDSMPAVLAARHRPAAGRTASPAGLCLMRVSGDFPFGNGALRGELP